MSTPTHLYRYTDHPYGELDEFETVTCVRVDIRLQTYTVISETPCGYHVERYGERKWVSKTSKKRLAHPTRDEAWTSFKARKTRQVAILKIQLELAQRALQHTQPKDQ
jgi:hypothetical protein